MEIVAVLSVFSFTFKVTFGTTSSILFVGRVIVIPSYFIFASDATLAGFVGSKPKSAFTL